MFVPIYKSCMGKKTLIIGASENPQRYAAQAVALLNQAKHPVIALGRKVGEIHGISIQDKVQYFEDLDTVSLYINPEIQEFYYSYILSLNPKRVIFNPGTENIDLAKLLKEYNIAYENSCTLVLLRTEQY